MANYKVVDADRLDADLTTVADAIRKRDGQSETMAFPDDYVSRVNALVEDRTNLTALIERTVANISDDMVVRIGAYAFHTSDTLLSANFPSVTNVARYAFNGCVNLASIHFPKLRNIGEYAFRLCAFASADLPALVNIQPYAFYGCSKLAVMILRSATACTLEDVNALGETPFASGGAGGIVYVPKSLISTYRTADNWSTLYSAGSCVFKAIEGSAYE